LVRAAIACQDLAVAFGTPFISGKDSLNNEFSYFGDDGQKQSISIPPSLLISAMGQIADIATAVTMDLKKAGNGIYLIGDTYEELGGSHYGIVTGAIGGEVPKVKASVAKRTFDAMHQAIKSRRLRSVHDLSEGGLAIAAAEMAMAGRLGIRLDVSSVGDDLSDAAKLFAESNTRFLVEVTPENEAAFVEGFRSASISAHRIGEVDSSQRVVITVGGQSVVDTGIEPLIDRWKQPLNW